MLGPHPFGLSLISGVTKRAGASPFDILQLVKSKLSEEKLRMKQIDKQRSCVAVADKVRSGRSIMEMHRSNKMSVIKSSVF